MRNLLFILPFLLSLSPTCFSVSQEDKDFQEYLKGFEDIPPSSQIYTKENRNTLNRINKYPDRRLVPKFFYGKPVALSPYVYYEGMTKFACGENIVTLIDVMCDTCAGNWQLGTSSIWMVSYTKEGKIIDRINISNEEHETFEGRFLTYSDSAVLLSFHTRLGIIKKMDYGEPLEGIVEYVIYDIGRDGRFTQRNEKTTKAIFADDRETGYYIKEEW